MSHAGIDPSVRQASRLAAMLGDRHTALSRQLPEARRGGVEGVHQARVASRRLREAVPVLGAGVAPDQTREVRKRLRSLTRALGAVRELDVALAMIGALELAAGDGTRLRRVWMRHLREARLAPTRALARALARTRLDPLHRGLRDLARQRAASDDAQWRAALGERLTDRARALRVRLARTGQLYRPEPLHDVRIAAKKLRYMLELVQDVGLVAVTRRLRTLKAAQDALGHLHDLDVLVGLLHALPQAAPGAPLQHEASACVGQLESESRHWHRRYLRTRAALDRLASSVERDVVPQIIVVSEEPGRSPRGRA